MGTRVFIGAVLLLAQCTGTVSAQTDQTRKPKNDPLDDLPGVFSIGTIVEGLGRAAGVSPPSNRTRLTARAKLQAARKASLQSGKPTGRAVVEFVNTSGQPRRLDRVDFTGNHYLKGVVMPGLPARWPTFVTHVWQVTDTADTCVLVPS